MCKYPHRRGKIHYTEMYDMLKNIDPPLGFGNKCPNRLAYKKLIRMNMPVDQDGKVQFTTTLFALIRENLSIKMRCGEWTLCIDIVYTVYVVVANLYDCQIVCYDAAVADEWIILICISAHSRRDGPGGRRIERDHQTHMAVTGQKDFGSAHSEKRLWVLFHFFWYVLLRKKKFFHLMYRSEYRKTDGRQDIRGSVDFRELEVHEIRSGRIIESTGNTIHIECF